MSMTALRDHHWVQGHLQPCDACAGDRYGGRWRTRFASGNGVPWVSSETHKPSLPFVLQYWKDAHLAFSSVLLAYWKDARL